MQLRVLLPAEISITIVNKLLKSPMKHVRYNAIELMNAKLLQSPTPFTRDHLPLLTESLDAIVTIFRDSGESEVARQNSAYSVKLFCRVIGQYETEKFLACFDDCCRLLADSIKEPKCAGSNGLLLGNALLCCSELIACFQVKLLAKLPDFSSFLFEIFDKPDMIYRFC